MTKDKLRRHDITHIINLTVDVPPINDPTVTTYKVTIDDTPQAKLGNHFDRLVDKIHENSKHGRKTLVHCVAGVSRSASICIAYLMKYKGLTLIKAYSHVKSRRSVIRPNAGFFQQLIEYEKKLYGKTTVSMVKSPIGLIPDVYMSMTQNMVWTTTYSASFGK